MTVRIRDIVYAEVFNRKVILHLKDGDIEYYGKLKDLEKKTGDDFCRTHRAFLANIRRTAVKYHGDIGITLKDGEFCLAVMLMME